MRDVRRVTDSISDIVIPRAFRYAWLALVIAALTMSVLLTIAIVQNQSIPNSKFMDFTVFWTAAGFEGDVYDVRALTAAQLPHLPSRWDLRPFSYPPSTLLLIKPLELLPYEAALYLWTVAGIAAFVAGALALGRKAIFGFAMLPVGMAILAGQLSLFLAGALSGATALLSTNPIAAGVLFGFVAATKPQIAVLVPVALIAGRHWKAIASSAATLGLILMCSLALGAHLWTDWLHGLPQFVEQTSRPPYRQLNIAFGPTYAPIGIALVAVVFRYFTSPSVRLLALSAGTLITVPYMLIYDLAVACPALAALLLASLDRRGSPQQPLGPARLSNPFGNSSIVSAQNG